MTKENVKTIALSACVSIITSLITVSMMTDTKSAIERKQVVLAPTVSSNQTIVEEEPTKGGLYEITTTDGKTLEVKIPDDMIKSLEQGNFGAKYNIYDLAGCLMNGTPLPEHHGRLIDADKIMRVDHILLESAIDNAPTIIEGSDSE